MKSNLDDFAAFLDALLRVRRGSVDEIIIDNRCYQMFRDIFCHSFSH